MDYITSFNKKPIQANLFQSLGLVEFSPKEIESKFDTFDEDHDGFLTRAEVRRIVERYETNPDKVDKQVAKVLKIVFDARRASQAAVAANIRRRRWECVSQASVHSIAAFGAAAVF